MSFIRGNKPIVINKLIPASATPAAADGLLTIVDDLIIPVNEIDRVQNVESATAGTKHKERVTFGVGTNLGAQYRITIVGYSQGAHAVQPLTFHVRQRDTGIAKTLNEIRDEFISAINGSNSDLVATSGGAGAVDIEAGTVGKPFIVKVYEDDATTTVVQANVATAAEAIGQVADLQALFPHLTISGTADRVKLNRTFKLDDGGIKKAEYNLYFLATTDATAVQNALDIGDTSAGDESPAAQTIQVN